MLVTESRPPRNLKWYHAGPLLFGDWGTSRLYVLGLAFFYTGHASPVYLAAMSLIMIGVAFAYSIICRNFTEGGGVYAVARQLSPTLSVIGATLLLADYIVTAALSLLDGMHYFGVPHDKHVLAVVLCVLCIGLVGIVNWFGARSAGRFALIIAVGALLTSLTIGVMCLPYFFEGAKAISLEPVMNESWTERWQSLVRIVLALSGVEAVANMTGLMKQPVAKTAKRTIWPVLAEVVILNMIFGIALTGLPRLVDIHKPDYQTYSYAAAQSPASPGGVAQAPAHAEAEPPDDVKEYRDTAVKVLAVASGERFGGTALGTTMGWISGIVFGLLLLSAANTAIMALVSVLYSLSGDKELPRPFLRLNYSGVPWIGLVFACVAPALLLLVMNDVAQLAGLYAVGVCGAITISVLGCAYNRKLEIKRWERAVLWVIGTLMFGVEITILFTKPEAAAFAGGLIVLVLGTRAALKWHTKRTPEPLIAPQAGWITEVERELPSLDPSRPKIMYAARTRYQAEYAVAQAKRRRAVLFALFVRPLRVLDVRPGQAPHLRDDPEALEALGGVAMLARTAGVPIVPIYVTTSGDIAEEILDYTVTFGCDTLIMGKSRRSLFSRKVAGDIVSNVEQLLPDDVSLIIRSASPTLVGADTEHKVGKLDWDAPEPTEPTDPDETKTQSTPNTDAPKQSTPPTPPTP
jgi:amino acid transporter/nucleotide-binding universal stress UspA family protein